MRGKTRSEDLQHDPEIEKTAKANRKAVRLARLAESTSRHSSPVITLPAVSEPITMGEQPPPPPARPMMGDYGLDANRGHLTHVFQPANPKAFDIKSSVQQNLKENQFDGRDDKSPHEHLSHFHETFQFYVPPANVTESQKKLRLFPFTLTGRAKDWLLSIPSGTIQTWDELELKFLKRFFPMSKYWDKKHEITNFKQGESETLYDAWERFNLLLKRCPSHGLDEKSYLQIFTEGITANNRMFLDAAAGGSMRTKTDHEVRNLIENMTENEHRADAKKKRRGVFGVNDSTALLANQTAMNKHLETLTKQVQAITMGQLQAQQAQVQQVQQRCDFCQGDHANGEYSLEGTIEEANYMGNYQKNNPYSNTYNPGYAKHPNLSYSNTNTLNPLLPNPPRQQPQQQQRPPAAWEEAMAKFMQMTQTNLEEMKASQEAERKNNEAARKMFETQLGQMAKQMAEHTKGGFSGNTQDNPKNESCKAIELRSKKVLTPLPPKVTKENENVEVEEEEQEVVEKNDDGVVENEHEKKDEGENIEKLIDVDSILRKTKSQILAEGEKKQKVPSYVKLPYPHLSKKKEKQEGKFKKFMELFS